MLAKETGYRYLPEGIAGQITTGDSIDWLTVQGVTAVEVELTTHQTLDWEQNQRGLLAFLNRDLPPIAPDTPSPRATSQLGQRIHIVVAGDTLYGLALIYDVSIDALLKANNLAIDDVWQIGQRIIIPVP